MANVNVEEADQEEPAGGLLSGEEPDEEKPDEDQAKEMPECFSIGTKRAYEKGNEYSYRKQIINMETVYVCSRRSDSARDNEFLLLVRRPDAWVAYDAKRVGNKLTMRQSTFRSTRNITKAGYHAWQINKTATQEQEFDDPDWSDDMWCITHVPNTESSG